MEDGNTLAYYGKKPFASTRYTSHHSDDLLRYAISWPNVIGYIVLNPVRARMVRSVKDWPWSSYRATAGQAKAHALLTTDWILDNFGSTREIAQEKYKAFVRAGKNQPNPWEFLKNQIYLGSDKFVEAMQRKINPERSLKDIPKPQKNRPAKPISFYKEKYKNRNKAMAEAYRSGHYTLAKVSDEFGVSYATVSKTMKNYKRKT